MSILRFVGRKPGGVLGVAQLDVRD